MEGACKNYRKMKILNGPETVKEGTSRGDTTTNLRNFSSRFFLVPTENLENVIVKHPGQKHDKYCVRKPPQLFRKSQISWTSVETGPLCDESGWESSILNLEGATNPTGTLPTPQTAIENSKSTKNPIDFTDPTVH